MMDGKRLLKFLGVIVLIYILLDMYIKASYEHMDRLVERNRVPKNE